MTVLNRILSILVLVGVVAAAAVTPGLVWHILTLGAVRDAWPDPPEEQSAGLPRKQKHARSAAGLRRG